MDEPKTPNCPMCGAPPVMMFGGGTQAFCGNTDDCPVFTWNPMESREHFLRTAKHLDVLPTGNEEA